MELNVCIYVSLDNMYGWKHIWEKAGEVNGMTAYVAKP
jgi:hypothetical protein